MQGREGLIRLHAGTVERVENFVKGSVPKI